MKTTIAFLLCASLALAEVNIPDGTKLRVRLDQTISSATADQGQGVELSTTEAIKIGDQVVIPEGSRVSGTIVEAQEKRHMGRAGKLDFSIDRVRCADGEWIPLRYTVNKKNGGSHAVSTGIMTAGAALLFWPAAPAFLLIKGKDVTINRGVTFDTFTDQDHVVTNSHAPATPGAPMGSGSGAAVVTVTSNSPGADIEVDGAFIGSTPSTLNLTPGLHQVSVRTGSGLWQRTVQVNAGSTVSLNAQPEQTQSVSRRLR